MPTVTSGSETVNDRVLVPRPGDLPYLIVGVVLGAFVFIIVAFIPFCLWRAWAKQSEWSSELLELWQGFISSPPRVRDSFVFHLYRRTNVRLVFPRRGCAGVFVPIHDGPSAGTCPGWTLSSGRTHDGSTRRVPG